MRSDYEKHEEEEHDDNADPAPEVRVEQDPLDAPLAIPLCLPLPAIPPNLFNCAVLEPHGVLSTKLEERKNSLLGTPISQANFTSHCK